VDHSRQRLLRSGRTPEIAPVADEEARADAAEDAYVAIAREHVAVRAEELHLLVADRIGLDPAQPGIDRFVDEVEMDLLGDPGAPVTMLVPDVVVHAPALTDGIVLTHRVTATELAEEHLDLDTDLAGFLRHPEPAVPAGPLHVDDLGRDRPVQWGGPPGWLSGLPEGALVAVRAAASGEVDVRVLDTEPAAPPELVTALREVYEAELEEPGLPVTAENLVLGVLYRDRSAFAGPRPPLTELAAAAGLIRRGDEFAHDESVWTEAAIADRELRLVMRVETEEQGEAAVRAYELLTADPVAPAALREALGLMEDPDVLESVAAELLREPDEDGARVRSAVALADRLLAAAGRSRREAVARWFAAVAAERDGRVLDAESHLRAAAVAAEGWPLVEDRLAWYESDRGDAVVASARWFAIDVPADDPDLAAVRPFAAAAGPEPGRNDPCWCGSGRKYKQCHRGRPAQAPLADRAPWLYRKAVTYLERRGGAATVALNRWAYAIAAEADDPEAEPDDELVADMALTEGGWFARFLADRGPLLPADEAELAASWADCRRSVFEVERVRFGVGATLRDLRGARTVEITAETTGRDLVVGELLMARALPDGSGSGHLLVGPVIEVQRGTEDEVLATLDEATDRRS
jgi:hypothetical protein